MCIYMSEKDHAGEAGHVHAHTPFSISPLHHYCIQLSPWMDVRSSDWIDRRSNKLASSCMLAVHARGLLLHHGSFSLRCHSMARRAIIVTSQLAIGTVVGSVTRTPAGRCVPGLPVAAVRHRYRKVQGMLVRDHWRALPIIYCHIFMLYVELGIYVQVHGVQ